jgi:ferredoxin
VSDSPYARLAEALDRLPGRFPRTPSGAEIPLLRRLFTDEQARLGAVMGRDQEEAVAIAARAGLPARAAAAALDEMADLGLVLACDAPDGWRYRLLQFIDGVFELNRDRFDAELAGLFEAYLHDGGARLLMGHPAYARVLPGAGVSSAEWILPFDDVRAILEQAPHIVLVDCTCRLERELAGEPCEYPRHVCLDLLTDEPADSEGEVVSVERALRILEECEAAGLVHTVSNVQGGWSWLCNCCSCCCEWLRAYTEFRLDTAVVRNYRAALDGGLCSGCDVCVERCQVAAIASADPVVAVSRETCIGCGLCVSTCPTGALRLERLAEAEVTLPPRDAAEWEAERLEGTSASPRAATD